MFARSRTGRPDAEVASIDESELSRADWRRLERWVQQGDVLHKSADGKKRIDVLELLDCMPSERRLAAGAARRASMGRMACCSPSRRTAKSFNKQHVTLIAALQEPMGVALDNDARLHELAALRDAAEAEKQSLLRRLGRSEVGRHDRRRRIRPGAGDAARRPGEPIGSAGADPGRNGHRQGAGRAGDSQSQRAAQRPVPARQLRRDPARADRFATVRPREGRVHGRERVAARLVRAGRSGDAVSGRNRRVAARCPGAVSCACCRTVSWSAWAARSRFASTSASSRPRIAIWPAWCKKADFARILWYRIAVFPILLPPLRDRTEDIPALARHFAQRAAIRFGLAPVEPTDADFELLQSYDWPGNIRELGAVIDRAAILGNGDSLELAAALGVGCAARTVRTTGRERSSDTTRSCSAVQQDRDAE